MFKRMFIFTTVLVANVALAQTTNTYTLPVGTTCNSGVENCSYEIANGAQSGVFLATAGYNMQFQYRAFPGQNPGYEAEYCNGLGTWTVADTPALGPTSKFYTMDCQSKNLTGVPSAMHAEIHAHSYVVTYPCGGRVRTICHQTRWAIDDGSTLAITK
jgi:hypothetical protein